MNKKQLFILRALEHSPEPLSGQKLQDLLAENGFEISERTVRFHLLGFDKEGLTKLIGKTGRVLTEKGRQVLKNEPLKEKLGFLLARMELMTFRMSYDLQTRQGTVVTNFSLIAREWLKEATAMLVSAFEKRISMGDKVLLIPEGGHLGAMQVPKGFVGIGTICSITANGILLKNGIPVYSRFGGLLEISKGKPERFTEVINYDGTTIDPLLMFVRGGMTRIKEAVNLGEGLVGASFRDIPSESRTRAAEISELMSKNGIGRILGFGQDGQDFMDIPVSRGRSGFAIFGGVNPVGLLTEYGLAVQNTVMSDIVDISHFFSYEELLKKSKNL